MTSLSFTMLLLLLRFFSIPSAFSQPFDYPSANLSTVWTNSASLPHVVSYPEGSTIRALLLRGSFGPSFALGFYCSAATCPSSSFLLALVLLYTNSGSMITNPMLAPPQVLWSPNRSLLVGENSTLRLTPDGELALYDSHSLTVWSTNTAGRSVSGLNLTASGNLVLYDSAGDPVWQSFEYPTDTLVVGQSLKIGQRLIANFSATNSSEGLLYLTVLADGLYAFVNSNPPQIYFQRSFSGGMKGKTSASITYTNGSLGVPDVPENSISLPSLPPAASMQYMRLEYDGHLRVYSWADSSGWTSQGSVFQYSLTNDCQYPTVCGHYGICSNGQQCSCPAGENGGTPFFKQVDSRQPTLGCVAATPLSCQEIQNHQLLAMGNVSYFDLSAAVQGLQDEASCKLACLKNCSCKAAFFVYGSNVSAGSCFLPSQLFSMMNHNPVVSHYNSSAFIKVQITPNVSGASGSAPTSDSSSKKGSTSIGMILGNVFGGWVLLFIIITVAIYCWRKRRARKLEEDDQFDLVPGMPTRFSYAELKKATKDFSMKLGQGGFGSVFEGTLADGTKVAVKRLDAIGQGKKEFLAEVETIGNIHHINLVRLVGFCVEKTHRLLVYEYMCNGSLDKWIFYPKRNEALDWNTRRKIIIDIAKGLSYLHEECRQRIAHLDIKPQNILLDDKFNAKVSDFGLSKLIDRDQNEVMTRMRGTPGYLAPEWLTSIITEKVDVYSFGVVVMEIVCGRKNLDYSQPADKLHLIGQLQKLIEANQLADLVDCHSDMQLHEKEAVETMELAIWCLQRDSNRRPSMSMVVKVLEGSLTVEPNLDLDFSSAITPSSHIPLHHSVSAPLLESILSGPR